MTIKVKKSGAYVDPVGIFIKKGGVYAAVEGIYAKVSGTYALADSGGLLLRAASPYNRVNSLFGTRSTTSTLRCASAVQHAIGSGARKNLYAKLDNLIFATGGVGLRGPGNAVAHILTQAICNGVTKTVTWNGSPTRTLADGEYDVLSDVLLPSDFGLTSFEVGQYVTIRNVAEVQAGQFIPQKEGSDTGRTEGIIYDPAVCTLNETGSFAPSVTGTEWSYAQGTSIMLVGEFVDGLGDPRTFMFDGDSMFANAARSAYEIVAASTAPFIAGMQVGRIGGQQAVVTDYPVIYRDCWLKYCNTLLNEYGTNNVGEGLGKLQGTSAAAWTFYRQNARVHPSARSFKILRTSLLVKTTGTFASEAGQTVAAGWDAGGTVDQFHAWLQAQLGVGNGPDAYIDVRTGVGGTIRDATNPYKWQSTNGARTGDGLHPYGSTAAILAANLRPAMDAIMAS